MKTRIRSDLLKEKMALHAVMAKKSEQFFVTNIVGMNYNTYKSMVRKGTITGKQYEKIEPYVKLDEIAVLLLD